MNNLIESILGTKVVSDDSYLLDWYHNGILVPKRAFEIASILHVALIVLLRWDSIKHQNKKRIMKHNLKLVFSIWVVSIVLAFLPIFGLATNRRDAIPIIRLVELYCSSVVPMAGIVFMYLLLIWELKGKQRQLNENYVASRTSITDDNVKRVTVVVSRVVAVFLICYLPFLAERQYYMISLIKGSYHEISAMVILIIIYSIIGRIKT